MTSPLTSSAPSTPSISDHESPLQQEQQEQQESQPKLQLKVDAHSADDIQNKQSPSSIESTDATVKTDIDLHHETATTTTIVHLPFQLGEQCPPPKVISWMKSHRAARHKTSAQHHHHHKHHRHHPHQRSSLLQHILPFLDAKKKRGFVDKTKRGDRAVTLFSIQVTVLGKVSVPSIPNQDPNNTNDIAPEQDSTRTIPAQLDRSETTSYVIHRTFEDFERLSEMVLWMGHSLHEHDGRRQGGHDSQGANISPEVQGEPVTPSPSPMSRGGPALTALNVHHPHPGLYQTLLKQFSNVKANQRAFDASSTTHGFNEEGAFERVLELNQYLENVWYWLLPENHPPHLDLSYERHEIIQWFKPLAQSAHADGRQMRERPPEDEQKRHSILQQYGSMSSIRREPAKDKNIDTARARQETLTAAEAETSSSSSSSSSSSPLSQETVTSGHADQSKHNYDETRSLSVLSVPSLSSSSCSSASCSSSSVSSISIPSDENQSGDRRQDDGQGDIKATHEASQTPSTATSSTLDSISEMTNEDEKGATIHIPTDQEQNLVSDPSSLQSDVKVKRRMSISHVFRSLTSPRSTHIQRQRQSMYETGNKRMLATSASMPIITGRNSIHHETLPEEIYIWNTVTTKYHAPSVPAAAP
ncbi:MAG: hypothetical protein J3Q66DRAFT_37155 [Benniella sp.]|nr:MAG: hypothetical protein J3Q66DRAFT_37155 [Benniella sp.]